MSNYVANHIGIVSSFYILVSCTSITKMVSKKIWSKKKPLISLAYLKTCAIKETVNGVLYLQDAFAWITYLKYKS